MTFIENNISPHTEERKRIRSSTVSLFRKLLKIPRVAAVRLSSCKIKYNIFLFILFSIIFTSFQETGAQEVDERTKFNISGTMRFRSFYLERDIQTSRQTLTYPVYDIPSHYNYLYQTKLDNLAASYSAEDRFRKPVPKNKDAINYFDSRALLNLEFATSKYLDGMIGLIIGDIPFGGRGIDPNTNSRDPYITGPGSGGEAGQSAGTNIQTNQLYMNFKLPEQELSMRVGIQLFSSIQGRVFLSTGAGAQMTKDFKSDKIGIEAGWVRARERVFSDLDSNGFSDRNKQSVNVFFWKVKSSKISTLKNELYSYYSYDSDPSDVNSETGNLYWHGLFNEFSYKKFNIIFHGIYNHGKVWTGNSVNTADNQNAAFLLSRKNISGYLWDFQASYFMNSNVNFNIMGIGTSGRPGYDSDGVHGSFKGSGYRTLAPGYAISNLAIDFIGGYALFNARNMSGLAEYGAFANIIIYGPLQLTAGYYQLYASKAPRLSVNRDYNSLYGNRSGTYLGDEVNLNLKWSVFSELQLIFRSGIFRASRAYYAINDFNHGKFAKEAFISAEYKF